MNWKKFVLLGCMVLCVFAASTATAQMSGHGGSMGRMPMHRPPTFRAMAQMPTQHVPMRNSAFGFRRFNRFSDFDRDDRFRRFNRFNDFDRDDRFRRFHHHNFNDIIVFDNFGFPFFPFPPPPPFAPF